MANEYIKVSTEGSVRKLLLNRPEKFNSFIREMSLQMQAALDEAATDPMIRAIFISGEGKGFCAGQDLSEAMAAESPNIKNIVTEHYNPIISKLRSIEKPIVCGVNGVAAGAGANIALACDVVVASASAFFVQAFSKIGLIPDCGGTFFLPRLIGFAKASALMMLGDKVSALEAEKMGMIYKVLEDNVFHQEAFAIAKTLSEMPTVGLGLTKKLLNHSLFNTLGMQLNAEGTEQSIAASSADYKEGVKAFMEKRKPVFLGN